MSGLVGCTRTRAICCVSARPSEVHVLPPSVVFQTPSPWDTLPRIGNSPAARYSERTDTGFGLLAAGERVTHVSMEGPNPARAPSVLGHRQARHLERRFGDG